MARVAVASGSRTTDVTAMDKTRLPSSRSGGGRLAPIRIPEHNGLMQPAALGDRAPRGRSAESQAVQAGELKSNLRNGAERKSDAHVGNIP